METKSINLKTWMKWTNSFKGITKPIQKEIENLSIHMSTKEIEFSFKTFPQSKHKT